MTKRIKVPTGAAHRFQLKEQAVDQAALAAVLREAAQIGAPLCEE